MSSATEGPLKVRFEDLQKVRNWSTRKPISRWYTAAEVATHSSATDCWVTISGRVYDVTSLFTSFPAHLYKPILTNGGKDISHWFEPRTFHRDINNNKHNTDNIDLKILLWYHPTRHMFAYFTPQGIFAGMPPSMPCSDFNVDDVPWWMDSKFVIGNLSIYTQLIRIKNILTDHVTVIERMASRTKFKTSRQLAWN
ncbi:hypothetical protein KC19_8G201200 [Ceratodon purpureus]|uniref:Cytochrome b5 domain-containing protein 1 n=1 Tax=Ceratodon purpureus TaxID=3225 RepID=A0A8T0H5X9_CERPU|nr:hypothetical protein KC19_8G201200 [Ceratodon purpureus]